MMKPRSVAPQSHWMLALPVLALLMAVSTLASATADDIYWDDRFGTMGTDRYVDAICEYRGDLYVGGLFLNAGGTSANYIVRWDGATWSTVGDGFDMGPVHSLIVRNDELIAGGMFCYSDGMFMENIARWDGTMWRPVSGGTNRPVRALALTDNGLLYAGGEFTRAGGAVLGTPTQGIAVWNGNKWFDVGGGVQRYSGALAAQGNSVYVGGWFTNVGGGTVSANGIARWDGSQWHALGSGTDNLVTAIAVDGNDVYVGGLFTTAGGKAANGIARWNGTDWFSVGGGISGAGVSSVRKILIDGSSVYATGRFALAGGTTVNNLARFDGTAWHPLGSGLNDQAKTLVFFDGSLYVGGDFNEAGGVPCNHFARWSGATPTPTLVTAFNAHATGEGIGLEWEVHSDEGILGFQLLRQESAGDAAVRVHAEEQLSAQIRDYLDSDAATGVEYTYTLVVAANDGTIIRSAPRKATRAASAFTLAQNHPNPFNPTTTIRFSMLQAGHADLAVYDLRGMRITTLIDGVRPAGTTVVSWNGTDLSGNRVASGVYFYRLRAGRETITRKMVILK